MKNRIIKHLIRLELLITLFPIDNNYIQLEKEKIINYILLSNSQLGITNSKELLNLREFNEQQTKQFITKNLKVLGFYED